MERIRSALGTGTHQRRLLELETPAQEGGRVIIEGHRRRLSDLQRWHSVSEQETGQEKDLYQDYITLQAVLGNLAGELGQVWSAQAKWMAQVGNREEAQSRALQQRVTHLKEQLARSLASLMRLANDLGISLEEAYLEKIKDSSTIPGKAC